MAYQNVATPVFYIDIFSWLKLNAVAIEDYSNFGLNTSGQTTANTRAINLGGIPMQLDYFAVLGHEMAGMEFSGKFADTPWTNEYYISNYTPTAVINCEGGTGDYYTPTYNGFSIVRFIQVNIGVPNDINYFYYEATGVDNPTVKVATFSMGKTYTCPHSPDLNLTLTRDYGGIKTIETKGGATLTNSYYTKPPMWGELGAWELEVSDPRPTQNLRKSGRRTWDLSFSYLSDSSLFPEMSSLSRVGEDGYTLNYDTHHDNTLLYGDDFYANVIHRTNGGQLPFIFQPDSLNYNSDQFAICKFDMNSFKFEQVANSVYNVKLKIREVW